jgi:hypothetical protein
MWMGGSRSRTIWPAAHLARSVAYDYPGFACRSIPNSIVVLDGPYQEQAAGIVRERLLLAGARLALVLEAALVPAAARTGH